MDHTSAPAEPLCLHKAISETAKSLEGEDQEPGPPAPQLKAKDNYNEPKPKKLLLSDDVVGQNWHFIPWVFPLNALTAPADDCAEREATSSETRQT
jgi:hypothetical protein